jgi:hypothetical protein
VIPDAGHFPHRDDPMRFVELLTEFVAETAPADLDDEELRGKLLRGA